ncbi:MAG: methylated-DNA--[protein]-cysteine S-methyltransferase [Rhodanobacteraceae bacterium]|nr:methylated-DNA--[protein]-cysteine S-methyltransferase [Rhodanobacteraceae bacterium]MBL0040971.1 methylated-DNA--[protein]-cysteine S-methyltransferase [Xanthomonadales bacterium]MBP7624365.1 methylated-DNA--[protein]-cysteine S-methyltransferase [Xanthomonadales bacterium]
MSPIFFDLIDSPIGTLTAAADDSGLRWLLFPRNRHEPARAGWQRDVTPFAELRRQLAAYFAGESQVFNLPLAPQGTNFQQSVWSALRGIPYGQTCSYRDIAHVIGNPKGVRAVGLANGRNPLPIIVPCHRVIGADGSMTGFGGGLDTKRFLLDLEARHADATFQLRASR